MKSRRMRWTGHAAYMCEITSAYKILVRKPVGKRSLGRPRCRWEDNIRTDLSEMGCGGLNWIFSAQDRAQWQDLVTTVMNDHVSSKAWNVTS
jgi:hypothetical protein